MKSNTEFVFSWKSSKIEQSEQSDMMSVAVQYCFENLARAPLGNYFLFYCFFFGEKLETSFFGKFFGNLLLILCCGPIKLNPTRGPI